MGDGYVCVCVCVCAYVCAYVLMSACMYNYMSMYSSGSGLVRFSCYTSV